MFHLTDAMFRPAPDFPFHDDIALEFWNALSPVGHVRSTVWGIYV